MADDPASSPRRRTSILELAKFTHKQAPILRGEWVVAVRDTSNWRDEATVRRGDVESHFASRKERRPYEMGPRSFWRGTRVGWRIVSVPMVGGCRQ